MATRKISYLAQRLDAISIQSEVFKKISQKDKGKRQLNKQHY